MIPSNNRCLISIVFLFFFSNHVFSQDTISNSYRDKIEITTSFGISIPRSDFMKHSNIGIRTMTGFQYRYNKNCTSPLKAWTKFRKQFRTIKLGNHEKRKKGVHP